MTRPVSDTPPNHAVLKQAAQWYARLGNADGDPALHEAWRHWHDEHPGHRQAWAAVERISQRLEPLQLDRQGAAHTLSLARTQLGRRRALHALGLVSGGLLLGWMGLRHRQWSATLQAWAAHERSGVGEVRALTLADGTQVWLNSEAALNVAFSSQRRDLHLVRGEILIQTAPDPRPLSVLTAQGALLALGTRLSVTQNEQDTRLCVFQGAVQIQAPFAAPRVIHSGEQIRFGAQGWGDLAAASEGRQSWARGLLLADNQRLGDFLQELGRYRHGYLGVAPEIADLRVVGSYPLHDTDAALRMLQSALPIRVHRVLPWWVSVEGV